MIIPTAMLRQLGLETEADVTVEDGALIIRALAKPARSGWVEASRGIVEIEDDAMLLPEFGNADDQNLKW